MALPLIPLRENFPHKTQGLCHSSCRYRGGSPAEEKPLSTKIKVRFEIRKSEWDGIKRRKKILQQGWTESNGGIYILTS